MSRPVLIASADADARAAKLAQASLEALGYAVEQASSKPSALKRAVGDFDRVLLVWSTHAARSAVLRRLARRALAARKLTCIRLARDAPPALRGVRIAPWPHHQAWKALMETTMDQVAAERAETDRYGAVLTMLLLALVAATALYAVDASFATRVNAAAESARNLVRGLIG